MVSQMSAYHSGSAYSFVWVTYLLVFMGTLADIERGGDQGVAAEGKDHRRCVNRAQTAEIDEGGIEIDGREGQLEGDDDADQKARDTPEKRGNDACLDHRVIVFDAFHRGRAALHGIEMALPDGQRAGREGQGKQPGMSGHRRILRLGRNHDE